MLGTAELVRHAGEVAGLGAQELADSLVERALAGAERRDDSLALVVRRTAPARSAWHMSWSMLTDDREAVCDARHELEAWLAGSDVDAAEAVLVAGELLANAAVAGGSSVTLSARRHDRGLVLVCSDDGVGGSHVAGLGYEAPEWDDEHGRGLFLIRLLCEDVQIDSTPSGTSISCELTAAA
jgi:anti-sigma regulatory factor (Ser/Thr protein kinase)